MLGLIGRKVGMTRYFTEEGVSLPVTLIQVTPNRVVQVKREERDGYDAVQLTRGEKKLRNRRNTESSEAGSTESAPDKRRSSMVNWPLAGHYAAHQCSPGEVLREFKVTKEELQILEQRPELPVDLLGTLKEVDITGTSKGKGFSGTIKRWNFSSQPASHGNSLSHRAPGSIGQNQTPGRVFKGKKMAGRLGGDRVTASNIEVVGIDAKRALLVVKGAVPGVTGSLVLVRPSRSSSVSILSGSKHAN